MISNVVARPSSTAAAGSICPIHTPEIGAGPVDRARLFGDGLFWVQRVILSFVAAMFPPTLGVGLVDEFILQ